MKNCGTVYLSDCSLTLFLSGKWKWKWKWIFNKIGANFCLMFRTLVSVNSQFTLLFNV